MVNPQ